MAYTKTTDFASKDSLPTGDPAKVVKGSEIDAEFDNIEAAIGTTTGSGAVVLATSPTLVTPVLGTPASGTVTNLTGTASININGTVGATTPNAGTFTQVLAGVTSATTNGGKIETSNGITFPATQSACSNANTLDDYEEGNHTPTVTASGGGTITLNTSADTLTYTKKGREVTVKGNIWFNEAAPSFTGAIRLTLPFTAANATDAGNTVCGSVVFNGINGDPTGFSVIINDSGTYMTVDRMLTTAAGGNFAGDAATYILPTGGGELSMLYLNITYDAT